MKSKFIISTSSYSTIIINAYICSFVVKTLRIDDEIAEDKREYLKALFQVVKVNRQINNKKARIYEIDFYNRKVNVYTKSWTLKKSHPAEMVITVEKHVATNLKCSITFLDSTRKSILTFSSPVHRDRFYELALAIKPGYIHYVSTEYFRIR